MVMDEVNFLPTRSCMGIDFLIYSFMVLFGDNFCAICLPGSFVYLGGSLLLQEGKCLNYEVPNSPSLWSPRGLLSAQGSTALKCINVTLQDYQNSFGIALSWRSCLQLTV